MDNSINPYQKLVVFLGLSILVGVGYFVYESISNNVKDVPGSNNIALVNFNKSKSQLISSNPQLIEKVTGSYFIKKENSQIIKKLDFKKDGNVSFSTIDELGESSSTEQVGTWFIDGDLKINLQFTTQKVSFGFGENGNLIPLEGLSFFDEKEDLIFIKE